MGAIEKIKVVTQRSTNGAFWNSGEQKTKTDEAKQMNTKEARTEIERMNRKELRLTRYFIRDAINDYDVYLPLWERELAESKESLAKKKERISEIERTLTEMKEQRAEYAELFSLCESRLATADEAAGEENH
jgi:hypothetical protein